MKSKTNAGSIVGGVILAVVLSAAVANAQSIGVNFYGFNGVSYPDTLAASSIAGVTAVQQANWNNLQMPNTDGNGHWDGMSVNGTLINSIGATVSGLSLTLGGNSYMNYNDPRMPANLPESKPYSTDGAGGQWGGSGNWEVMENGMIYPSAYFDFTGITYSTYNVFVYIAPNGGNGGYNNTVALTALGGSGTVDPVLSDGAFTYPWSPNVWTQGGNYVEFTGNTATSLEINMPFTGGWNGGIAAIEIVNTGKATSATYTVAATSSAATLHTSAGTSSATITTTLTNTGVSSNNADTIDYTNVTAGSTPAGATLSAASMSGTLAANALGNANVINTQTFSSSVAGTYTVSPAATTITGATLPGAGQTFSATVAVYDGLSTWNGGDVATSITWSDNANWSVNDGAPGMFASSGFANTDTATFNGGGGSGPITVNVDQSPSIKALTLNSTASSYTLAGAGTLHLSGTPATVNVTGSHVISALVALDSVTTITTNNTTDNLLISGSISGSSLTATGSGVVTLSAANTYTGGTTVSGGTVIVTNASGLGTGSLTVGNGATLDYIASTSAPLTVSSLTLTSSRAIGASIGSSPSTTGKIAASGAATTSGSNIPVNVYAIAGVTPSTGTYPLVTATGGLTGATYQLGAVYDNTNFTVNSLAASATAINVSVASQTALTGAYWEGGLGGNANVWAVSNGSTASNWATNSTGTATGLIPGIGATVTFSASGASNQSPMVLGAPMSVKGIVVNSTSAFALANDANTLTIGSSGITANAGASVSIATPVALAASQTWANTSGNTLSVSGALTNNGSQTLTVSGTSAVLLSGNVYLSATSTTAGTLTVTGSGTTTVTGVVADYNTAGMVATPTNSSNLVYSGTGSLALTNANTYSGATTINSGTFQLGNGTTGNDGSIRSAAIVDNGALIFDTFATQSSAAVISGSGSLSKLGAGALTLTGANTYTGITTVSAGTLQLGDGTTGHDGAIASASIADAGTLVFDTFGGQTIKAAITGAGNLVKLGGGTLTLSGTNGYTGSTTITAGNTVLANASAMGSGALILNGGSLQNTVAGGVTLANTTSVIGENYFKGNYSFTLSGTVTGNGAAVLDDQLAGAVGLNVTGKVYISAAAGTPGTFGLGENGNGTTTVSGVIADFNGVSTTTTGSLVIGRGGSGWNPTVILSGANTYTGTTTISSGTLVLANANALGGGGGLILAGAGTGSLQAGIPGITLTNAVTLNGWNNTISGANTLTLAGTFTDNDGTTPFYPLTSSITGAGNGLVLAGNVYLSNSSTTGAPLTINGTGTTTITGVVANYNGGPGTASDLIYAGRGTLAFSGSAATYTGYTAIDSGTLLLNFAGAASPTNLLPVIETHLAGATMDIVGKPGAVTTQSLGFLALDGGGASTILLNNNGATSTTLNLGALDMGANPTAATLNIVTTAGANVTATNAPLADGTYGPRVIFNGTTTSGDWTTSTAGSLAAYTAYTTFPASGAGVSTVNYRLTATSASSGNETINSLKIAPTGTGTLTLGTLNLANGGLLFTGTNAYTIGGTALNAGATGELIVQNYSTGTLTISATIAEGSTTSALTVAGPGTTVLTNTNNTYTGQTYLTGGTLSVSNNGSLGLYTAAAGLNINGGTLKVTSAMGLGFFNGSSYSDNRTVALGSAGGTFDITAANTLTVGGIISGSGSLTKTDTGILQLAAVNTFSGGTFIQNGTVQGGVVNFLPGSVSFGNGATNGTLDLNGFSTSVSTLAVAAGATTPANQIITNSSSSNAATLTVTAGGSFAGAIQDGINGEATELSVPNGGLFLSGNNTFSGGLHWQGTIVVGSPTAVGAGRLSLSDGGLQTILDLNGQTETINSIITYQPGQDIIGNSSTTTNAVAYFTCAGSVGANTVQGDDNSVTGMIVDAINGGTKTTSVVVNNTTANGNGVALIMGGVNTFTGGLNIQAGTVQASSATGSTTALGAGVVTLGSSGQSTTLDLNGQTENVVGLATAGTASSQTIGNSATTPATLNYAGTTTSTFGGVIQDILTVGTATGTAVTTQTGTSTTAVAVSSGALVLTGTNTYTGGSIVNGGTLEFAAHTALPSATATLTANNGGTLAVAISAAGYTTSTSGTNSLGAFLANPNLTWNTGSALGIDTTNASGGIATYAGSIAGNQGLNKIGAGSLVLTAANTYAGATTVSGGTLKAGIANAIATTSALAVSSGATFDLGGFNQQVGALSGSGTVTTTSGAPTLTVSQTTNSTFNGALSGTGLALNKAGSGTLTLAGTVGYTGGTTVSGGTLVTPQVTTSLSVSAGAHAVLTSTAGANTNASVLPASAFFVAAGGSVDLTDNGVIITGATMATQTAVASMISSGELISSVVAAHTTNMTIEYGFASNISTNTFVWGGQTISAGNTTTDLLILPTLKGDGNMDGQVNGQDFLVWQNNYGTSVTGGATKGDYDGNGIVNGNDFLAWQNNYGQKVSTQSAPNFAGSSSSSSSAVTASPEPASLALLALGGLLVLPRRRNRHAA
jgi:fibronectin-binding autotransporter adhesin